MQDLEDNQRILLDTKNILLSVAAAGCSMMQHDALDGSLCCRILPTAPVKMINKIHFDERYHLMIFFYLKCEVETP